MISFSIEQSVVSVMITSLDGRIEYVNSNFTNLTGYLKDEVIGKNPRILKSGEQSHDVYVKLWSTITSGNEWKGTFCNRKKNGELHWELQTISPVKNEKGNITHFVSIKIDETERIRVEKELLKSQKSLAKVQRISHFGNWDWDIVSNKLHWSDEIYHIFGLPLHKFEPTYESFLEIVHPDDRELVKMSIHNAMYKNIPYNVDHRVVLSDGAECFVHADLEVTFDKNEKPVRMKGTVHDITERRQLEASVLKNKQLESRRAVAVGTAHNFTNVLPAFLAKAETANKFLKSGHFENQGEASLETETAEPNGTNSKRERKRSLEYLRVLFDYAPDAYYLSDLKGTFFDANNMAEEITGYNKEELIGKNFFKLKIISTKQIPKIIKLLFRNARGLSTGPDDIKFCKKDGNEVMLEIRTFPVKLSGKTLVLGIARDVTKRKQLEWELEESLKNLEIIVYNRTLELQRSNKKLKREVKDRILIENVLRISEKKYRLLMEQASDGILIADKNGIYTDANSKACEMLGYEHRELLGLSIKNIIFSTPSQNSYFSVDNLLRNKTVMEETCLRRKNGSLVEVEISAKILDDGRIQYIVRDITDRKKLEESFIKAQKLESLGTLAGGIAHDFNNILAAILGNSELIGMYLRSGDYNKANTVNEKIEKSAVRAKDLSLQLLTFAKGGVPIKKVELITRIIEDAATLAISGSNVKCHFIFPDNLWSVEVDAGQISQVINNLIINATHAMPSGGIIKITGKNIDNVDSEESAVNLQNGRYKDIY